MSWPIIRQAAERLTCRRRDAWRKSVTSPYLTRCGEAMQFTSDTSVTRLCSGVNPFRQKRPICHDAEPTGVASGYGSVLVFELQRWPRGRLEDLPVTRCP